LFQWGQEADEQNQCVFFWCSAEPKKKSNAAVLVGAYLVLFGGVEAEAAYETLSRFQPFMPFRDPTCGISTYHLSVYDCIQVPCFSLQLALMCIYAGASSGQMRHMPTYSKVTDSRPKEGFILCVPVLELEGPEPELLTCVGAVVTLLY
jgi:cell division cycle 14